MHATYICTSIQARASQTSLLWVGALVLRAASCPRQSIQHTGQQSTIDKQIDLVAFSQQVHLSTAGSSKEKKRSLLSPFLAVKEQLFHTANIAQIPSPKKVLWTLFSRLTKKKSQPVPNCLFLQHSGDPRVINSQLAAPSIHPAIVHNTAHSPLKPRHHGRHTPHHQ